MARRPNQPPLYDFIRDPAALRGPAGDAAGAKPPQGGSQPAGHSASPSGTPPVPAPGSSAVSPPTLRPTTGVPARSVAPAKLPPVKNPASAAAPGAHVTTTTVGRSIRLPLGYVWMIAGGGLLLLILTYSLGHAAGGARVRAERVAELERRLAGEAPIEDPLLRDGGLDLGGAREATGGSQPAGASPGSNPPSDGARGKGSAEKGSKPTPAATAVGGEPRQPDWYYLVVAHPRVEHAPQLVEFLKSNGLDAHVVRDHNGVARKVIVLPGFATKAERSSPTFTQLWDRLQAAGLKWKSKAKGNSTFGDAYLELYRRSS